MASRGASRATATDERIFRILVENGINIHAEVIPRSRFKKMVEGASRTAFSCNFFAQRAGSSTSKDPSIDELVQEGQQHRDEGPGARSCLTFSTWTIHAAPVMRASAWTIKGDLETGGAGNAGCRAQRGAHRDHPPAAKCGKRTSSTGRSKAAPALFQTIYLDVLAKRKNRRGAAGGARRDRRLPRRSTTRLT